MTNQWTPAPLPPQAPAAEVVPLATMYEIWSGDRCIGFTGDQAVAQQFSSNYAVEAIR